jgi:ABC-2 type transport system ATP-binding protein
VNTPVSLEKLTKTFGRKTAVNDLSLSVTAGQTFGLIGANGAGKTTTFSMLAGYLEPTSGSVKIFGHHPKDTGALRNRVGVLPQDALLPSRVRAGALLIHFARLQGFSAAVAKKMAVEMLDQVGLAESFHTRCGTLSHGMAKRVGIAQAFLGDPELVLLDEPTAGLDPKNAHHLRELIRARRANGRTIIISSHNLHELESLCDAAAIIDRGRLVAHGTMSELTGASREVRIVIAGGEVAPDALRSLPGVSSAAFDPVSHTLSIRVDTQVAGMDEVTTRLLTRLIADGHLIVAVAPGHSLEDQVMRML